MPAKYEPKIGDWYRNEADDSFEIVALDEEDGTVEIQYFDGTVEEFELDSWAELPIVPTEPPEDWSGSLDIQREDYGVDLELSADSHNNPLDTLDSKD